jgi:hypothetical protein
VSATDRQQRFTPFATELGPFTSAQQFEVGVAGARVTRND